MSYIYQGTVIDTGLRKMMLAWGNTNTTDLGHQGATEIYGEPRSYLARRVMVLASSVYFQKVRPNLEGRIALAGLGRHSNLENTQLHDFQ